jgi:hypothetical protein
MMRPPYDWDASEPHRSPLERVEPSREFWRGFAFGVPVALALWLAAGFLTYLLLMGW